jgi:hypothetical protein
MLLYSSGMLPADLTGMLSRLGGILLMSEGMLSIPGMSLAEIAGMLRKLFSVLLALPSMLPLGGMLLLGVCYHLEVCYQPQCLLC